MLIVAIVIELMVAFHVHIITLEPLWKKLLWSIRFFLIILDLWLYNSAFTLNLHEITLTRCIQERVRNLWLQYTHHLSHRTNHTIEAVSFGYSYLSFKHSNHFFDSKLYRSSRISHIVNYHIEEYLRILKFDFKLLYIFAVILLQLRNFFLKHLVLLLTCSYHLQIVELL